MTISPTVVRAAAWTLYAALMAAYAALAAWCWLTRVPSGRVSCTGRHQAPAAHRPSPRGARREGDRPVTSPGPVPIDYRPEYEGYLGEYPVTILPRRDGHVRIECEDGEEEITLHPVDPAAWAKHAERLASAELAEAYRVRRRDWGGDPVTAPPAIRIGPWYLRHEQHVADGEVCRCHGGDL